jgi:3-deoxy-D-manno-octulosonic-acid transferase
MHQPLWVHNVSVGEFLAAQAFIERLIERHPERDLVVSTTTLTGQRLAREKLPARVVVLYFPLDFFFLVRRALRLVRPCGLVLMETELWPAVIREARRLDIPVVQLNGRLSDTSYRRFLRFSRLARPLFEGVTAWGMQSPDDAARIRSLGVPAARVHVTGNCKFEAALGALAATVERRRRLMDDIGFLAGRQLLVIGSTHHGEDGPLLGVFVALRQAYPGLRLLIAPRHPERVGEIETLARQHNLNLLRRSTLSGVPDGPCDGVILDTIGELAGAYEMATLAVVGGSFIPHGGQNPLEPAAFGKLTFCGPSMENFRVIVAVLTAVGALEPVDDTAELRERLTYFLAHPEEAIAKGRRGQDALAQNRGAVDASLAFLAEHVSILCSSSTAMS